MIKIVNHESKLNRATGSLKIIAQFFVMALVMSGFVSAEDGAFGFSAEDAQSTGGKIYWAWYYFGRWVVMLFTAGMAVGNMLWSNTIKLHWGWAILIFIAIGMFGDSLFGKLADVSVEDMKAAAGIS